MGSLPVVKMQLVLALSVLVSVAIAGSDYREFHKWAKNKAFESCFGEDNMKVYTVQMKKAVAKCSQQDAPELLLPQFRAPYKTVNALLEASDDMQNNDMQMMFKMFKFMQQASNKQDSYYNNQYNQFRPYSNNYQKDDDMDMPMKWMMKMMMNKVMQKNTDMGMYDNNPMDVMEMRSNDPMEARMDQLEAMLKSAYNNKMKNNYEQYNMKNSEYRNDMFNDVNRQSNMKWGMYNRRQTRATKRNIDLGDRLVERLQFQKEEMQDRIGNLTCVLQEMNVLDNNNKLSIFGMKKDLAQYNLPSQWFKENYEQLL